MRPEREGEMPPETGLYAPLPSSHSTPPLMASPLRPFATRTFSAAAAADTALAFCLVGLSPSPPSSSHHITRLSPPLSPLLPAPHAAPCPYSLS